MTATCSTYSRAGFPIRSCSSRSWSTTRRSCTVSPSGALPAVLITGATGFTGANLVRRFAARHRVVALDRVAPDAALETFWAGARERITSVTADLRDERVLDAIPAGIDAIVHAAAITNPRGSEELARSAESVEVNAGTCESIARWAASKGVRRLVVISSSAPYGTRLDGDDPIEETDPPEPDNVYAIGKYAGELLAQRVGALSGLDVVTGRFTSAYGPMERTTPDRAHTSAIHGWFVRALRGEEIRSDRSQAARDYTYIDDVCSAVEALASAPALRHGLYNISSGTPVPAEALMRALALEFPGAQIVLHGSEATARRRPFSTARLRDEVGWLPAYDLRAGFAAYAAWMRANADYAGGASFPA